MDVGDITQTRALSHTAINAKSATRFKATTKPKPVAAKNAKNVM